MRIEAARKFLEEGVYGYNPKIEETNPFGECLRAIHRSKKICYQERVELIELFKKRVALQFSGEEADVWVSQANQCLQNRVENKFVRAVNMVSLQVESKAHVFIEQLVLDSKAQNYRFRNQVTQQEAIVFYQKQLQAYNNLYPGQNAIRDLMSVLAQALRFTHFLGVAERLETHSLELFFMEFEFQLKLKALPYLFVPLYENSRGLMVRIDWNEGEGFSCTLINTGRDALLQDHANQCADIRYEGLNVHQLRELIVESMNFARNPATIYQRFAQNDLLKNHSWKPDRTHHMHRGVSSTTKSLASAIHGALGTPLYRTFKSFLTENLLQGQIRSIDLQVITTRREWKALSHRQ